MDASGELTQRVAASCTVAYEVVDTSGLTRADIDARATAAYREATSVMVARALGEKGISTAVIRGGLEGWKKASLPLEPVPTSDVVTLPKFS